MPGTIKSNFGITECQTWIGLESIPLFAWSPTRWHCPRDPRVTCNIHQRRDCMSQLVIRSLVYNALSPWFRQKMVLGTTLDALQHPRLLVSHIYPSCRIISLHKYENCGVSMAYYIQLCRGNDWWKQIIYKSTAVSILSLKHYVYFREPVHRLLNYCFIFYHLCLRGIFKRWRFRQMDERTDDY